MPILLLVVACALWGVSFPLVKVLHLEQAARIPDASTLFLSAWMQSARFGLGALLLAPFLVGKGWATTNELRQGLQLAIWGGLGMWMQADALAYTDASTSAFLTQAYCIFLPLWAALRLKKWPATRVTVATLMVIVGGAVLSGIRSDRLHLGRGELETLGSAVLFTFQILALENPRHQNNRALSVTFIMFGGIAILFLPITLMTAPSLESCLTAGASWPTLAFIAALALLCSVGAYGLMNTWQPRVSATEAGLIYTSEPVFTAIYVLFLPALLEKTTGQSYANESLTIPLVVGGTLILAANFLMQWKRPAHAPPLVVGR
jgi:drug/metabolite transporter (DMT)-like permease